jgi:hypothetical protein
MVPSRSLVNRLSLFLVMFHAQLSVQRDGRLRVGSGAIETVACAFGLGSLALYPLRLPTIAKVCEKKFPPADTRSEPHGSGQPPRLRLMYTCSHRRRRLCSTGEWPENPDRSCLPQGFQQLERDRPLSSPNHAISPMSRSEGTSNVRTGGELLIPRNCGRWSLSRPPFLLSTVTRYSKFVWRELFKG